MATKADPVVPTPAPSLTAAPVAAIDTTPKSYLAMMLLAVFLAPSGLARAYRGEPNGWTRFWVFVGIYAALFLLFWVPFLGLLLMLALFVLYVWGVIDVFKLYKVRTDAAGQALLGTPRDEKFAKAFYIVNLIGVILAGLGLLLGLIFGTLIAAMVKDQIDNPNSPYHEYYNSRMQSPGKDYDSLTR